MNGPNLHGLQYRILKRGIELLEVSEDFIQFIKRRVTLHYVYSNWAFCDSAFCFGR